MSLRVAIAALLLGACAEPTLPLAQGEAVRLAQTRAVPESRTEVQLSFAPVVKRAAPAVVNIYTRKLVERRVSPFADDPFFREFFGDVFRSLPGRRRIENSLGSGVILDPDGIVVSNHHVVGGADEITVVLADRREFEARVIFADEASDLAVLELDGATDLPALEMRDSDLVEVGDLVLAIGNPFGVGQTVTSGIVSGLARSGSRRMPGGYFIQTDAAINPGNSGGALVDMSGRLIGVNTAILSRSGGSNGIGFAVPADLVARVLDAARAGERELARPWLGLRGQTVDGDLAVALGLAQPQGLLIDDLHAASPLAAAGLRAGDVVVSLDGDPVESVAELDFRAATLGTGREAEVGYLRDGRPVEARVALAPAPETPPRERTRIRRGPLAGLSVESVNPAVIDEYDLPLGARGVLVTGVRGPSRRIGLRPGDLVIEANGRQVARASEVVRSSERAASAGRLAITFERGGQRGTILIGG